MPANTPIYGWPYPLPTEPVAEGAQAIRNLAERLELHGPVISGNFDKMILCASSSIVALDAAGRAVIPYGITFAGTPSVTVSNGDEGAGGAWFGTVLATGTLASFIVHCIIPWTGANATGTVRVNWVAVGPYGALAARVDRPDAKPAG